MFFVDIVSSLSVITDFINTFYVRRHLVLKPETCIVRQYGLWIFQTGYTKLERFLHKNQYAQRKLLYFENWTNGEPQYLAKIRVCNVDYFIPPFFWCQNWDQWHKMSGKNTHIYFFYYKQVWAEKIGKKNVKIPKT